MSARKPAQEAVERPREPRAVFDAPDPRLVALNSLHVPRIRRRLETIRHQLVMALGALHSASVIEPEAGDEAIPGSIVGARALCASAQAALATAFEETEWLSQLPGEVLDGHAPDCDQREALHEQGFGEYESVRRVAVAEAARLDAIFGPRGDAR